MGLHMRSLCKCNEIWEGKCFVQGQAHSVQRMLVESESCVEVEMDSEEVTCHWAFQEAEVSLDFEKRERHSRRMQLLLQRRGGRKAPG